MKKRIVSLLLCVVLCFSLLPTAAFAENISAVDGAPVVTTPAEPTGSVDPVDPVDPIEPANPVDPIDPTAPENDTPAVDEAVAAVQTLIDALPTVETVTAADYDAVQDAYDAYDALSGEQQAQITGAEAFKALFDWFNSRTATTSTQQYCIVCGKAASENCEHDASKKQYFTVLEETDPLPSDSGNYYLDHAVTLTASWEPASGTVLYLDSNAVIYGPNNEYTIMVTEGKTFTLTGPDSNAGKITHKSGEIGAGVSVVGSGATFNMYGGTITGNAARITTGDTCRRGGGVKNEKSATFNLYGGTISGNNVTDTNGKIFLGGGVYNDATFTMSGGIITNNKATQGNGVYNAKSATFTMTGGTITYNDSLLGNDDYPAVGGGVYNKNKATFTMSGGTIGYNNATNGGGVYNATGATFAMSGAAKLDSNEASVNGGGVYNATGASFTMSDNAAIIGNKGRSNMTGYNSMGGGVYNEGSLTLTGGTIRNNNAYDGGGVYTTKDLAINSGVTISDNTAQHGGGVYATADLTIGGGQITGNTAKGNGGGVYVKNTATMTGGTIDNNKAYVGGGVYVGSGAAFTMTAGTITKNEATRYTAIDPNYGRGGGVCVENGATFALSDSAEISENQADGNGGGVYNAGNLTMTGGTISSNSGGWRDVGNAANYDGGGGVYNTGTLTMSGGQIRENSLGQIASLYGYGGGVYNSGTFNMSGDAALDGNMGKSEYGNGYGGGVGNRGTFTMSGNAKIINSEAGTGGGVYALAGSFTMSGNAEISGNKAEGSGGGIYINDDAKFTMNGGRITNNEAARGNGGGIYNRSSGAVKLTGGEISGNHAYKYTYTDSWGWENEAGGQGGGVYNSFISTDRIPTFNMSGGIITGNTADRGGAGVYLYNEPYALNDQRGSRLIVSGNAQIIGNHLTDGTVNNVGLYKSENSKYASGMVTVNSATFCGSIGITSDNHVEGWQVLGGNAVSAVYGYFTSDVSGFSINSAGKLACGHTGEQVTQSDGTYSCTCGATGFVATVTRGTGESATVSYYQTVEAASSAAINGSTLTLLTDQAYGVELNGSAAYTLDIAGKKLNMGLTVSNGTVTIKNPSTEVKMRLTVTGGTVKISEGVFDTVNVTGGKVEISGGTFKKLTVSASGNAVLSGGSFESGVFNRKSGGKANDLLAEGYCYWKTTKDDSYAGTSSAVDATIVDLINRPTSLSVTASKSEVTYGYASDAVTLTAVLANEDGSVTYQWYLNNAEQTGGNNTFTFPAGKDAGEYTIECKATAGGKTYTATVTIKVEKAALTEYTPSCATGMSYTSEAQALVSDPSGLPDGCKVLYRQKDGTWKTDIPTGTDAGSYTVYWYIEGGTNHIDVGSSTSPNSLTVEIAPKTFNGVSVMRQEKVYDGTTAVTVTKVTFKDSNNEHVSLEPSDYTVSANFEDANVGTNKKITTTVTLLNDNYTFKDYYGNNTKTQVLHVKDKIIPMTLSTTEPLKRYVNAGQTYTYQLNELLSSLTGRADYGEITWRKPEFEYAADTAVDTTYYGNATIIGDNLTLHIKGNSTGRKTSTDGLIGTLTLTATAPTIQTSSGAGFKMQVKLYLSEKTLVVRPEGGLNPSAITYGQPLSKSEISTKPVAAGTATEVEGTFAWVNGNRVPEAGTRWAEWTFTPTDKDTYESVNGAAAVTVNKATPTIKYGANELGENKPLNKTYDTEAVTFSATHQVWDGTAYNEKTVGGTWNWEKVTGEGESKTYTPAAAPVNVAGSGTYRVTFTPNDTTNYKSVTFSVTVTISPKALTFFSASADNRAYKPLNGYVTLTLGELDGIFTADQGRLAYSLDYASIGTSDGSEYQEGDGQEVTIKGTAGYDGIRLIGEAAGNYTLTQPTGLTVNITPRDITNEGIKVTLPDDLAYTGGVPTVTIEDIYDKVLVEGTDYTISGAVTTVGTHTLTITGMGNYEGTRTVNYSIEKKEITRDMVTISSLTYNGNSQSPTVTVTNGATELTKGTDYTVTVTPQTDAGSYRLNVVAKEDSNYTGGVTCYWSISPKVLQVESATVQNKSYDGTATATVESVTFKDGVSLEESDYTASAEFADAEVGEDKDVTVTVTLLNPNYCFMESAEGETQETTVATLTATANIVRATWSGQRPTAKEDPLRVTQDQTLLSGDVNLLANLPDNSDIAGIRVGSFSLGALPTKMSAGVDADGRLSFTITGGKAGDSFTIPVTFTCANYLVGEETPLTISFNVVVELTGAGHEPIRRQPIFTGAAGGNGGAAGGTTGGAEVTSPATSDAGIAVYALLSLCAALGTGVTVGRKKRKH